MQHEKEVFEPYKIICPVNGKEVTWLPEKTSNDFFWLLFIAAYSGPEVVYRCSISGSDTCRECEEYSKKEQEQ